MDYLSYGFRKSYLMQTASEAEIRTLVWCRLYLEKTLNSTQNVGQVCQVEWQVPAAPTTQEVETGTSNESKEFQVSLGILYLISKIKRQKKN